MARIAGRRRRGRTTASQFRRKSQFKVTQRSKKAKKKARKRRR